MTQKNQLGMWAYTIFMLIVASVSIQSLHADSLYIDERISVAHLGHLVQQYDLIETAQSIAEGSQQHSSGYFWLLNTWARLTGYSQVALRYLSVLIGIVSLSIFYRVGHAWYGSRVAIIALSLVSASALNIYYFHEMRMYSLVTLLMLLLMWQYARVIRKDYYPTRLDWVGLCLVVISLLYTHYFAIFPLAGIGVYHLLFVPKTRRWWLVCLVMIIAGLSFLPWLGVAITGTNEVAEESRNALGILASLRLFLWLFANGWLVLMGISIIGLVLALRDIRKILLSLVICTVTVVGLLTANIFLDLLPIRRSRYFLIILPFAAIVVAYGLAHIPQRRFVLPVIVTLWFISGIHLHYQPSFDVYTNRAFFQQDNQPPFHRILRAFYREDVARTPDDLLLMVTNTTPGNITDQPFYAEFYWRRLNVIGRVIEPMTFSDDDQHPSYNNTVEYELSLNPIVVYLGYDPSKTDANYHQDIVERLSSDYVACEPIEQSPQLHLEVYVRQSVPCAILDDSNITVPFQEQPLELQHYALNATDDELVVITRWAMMADMPIDSYSYSLRIVDESGEYVAQNDQGIPLGVSSFGEANGTIRHALTSLDTSDWQTGRYDLRIVAYNWQTGIRLTANDGVEEVPVTTFIYDAESKTIQSP